VRRHGGRGEIRGGCDTEKRGEGGYGRVKGQGKGGMKARAEEGERERGVGKRWRGLVEGMVGRGGGGGGGGGGEEKKEVSERVEGGGGGEERREKETGGGEEGGREGEREGERGCEVKGEA